MVAIAAPDCAVLVVGGGIVGLSMAAFLAHQGVKVMLLERRAEPSTRLRAKLFYARTIELYRSIGLEQAIVAASPKSAQAEAAVVRSLAGEEVRRWRLPTVEGSSETPCRPSTIKQHDLEVLVRNKALALGADMRFGDTLVDFTHGSDGVEGIVRGGDGYPYRIRAEYLVGCDGAASSVRKKLGVETAGYGDLVHSMGVGVRADIREALRGRPLAFAYVQRDDIDAYMAWDIDTHQVAVSVTYDPATTSVEHRFDDASCRSLAASCIGLPIDSVELLETYPWHTSSWIAERYRSGRVLLAGDALHSVPPHGGFGANTGIHDAHNLALKLLEVLLGRATDALLDSYEQERRPVAALVAAQATSRGAGRHALRVPAAAIEPLIEEDAITMGYRYGIGERQGSVTPNPIAFHPNRLHGEVGTRAPHVVLERNGARMSTLDLFGQDLALLAGRQAGDWAERAACWLRGRGQLCSCTVVGRDCTDVDNRFEDAYGMTSRGAALVRQDGFVVWSATMIGAFDENSFGADIAAAGINLGAMRD